MMLSLFILNGVNHFLSVGSTLHYLLRTNDEQGQTSVLAVPV